MKTVNGIYTSAKIFTDTIEEYALAQIQMLCNYEALEGYKIRIMPDVHPGKVGTIGLTAVIGEKILLNLVGIDMGCGITMVKINKKRVDFQQLDKIIREKVPSGFAVRKKIHRFTAQFDIEKLYCYDAINRNKIEHSLGTLGSGNHFIELDKGQDETLYLTVHSGSRHLGNEVTEYYLREGQKYLKNKGRQVPYEMTWLENDLKEKYLHDLKIVQEYANLNRDAIIDEIIKNMKWKVQEKYCIPHNYVYEYGILRKGAISANKGEIVVIPINMRDGIILGVGLGNEDWNQSAPHGSGRIMNREKVRSEFTVSQFKNEMKGIFCSVIGKGTLDEAPFAYRSLETLAKEITDTVQIIEIIKPIYNYKSDVIR